jgi:putative acetyltransferase
VVGAGQGGGVLIRRETGADVAAVQEVVAAAFGGRHHPDGRERAEGVPVEATLVAELRAGPAWLPAHSLVAAGPDGEVVGHVLCTRAHVEAAPVLALGPLAVHPAHQHRGVGLALVHAALGGADAQEEPAVVLLGDPAYYGRFGFRLAEEYGITPPRPEWRGGLQVRTLAAYSPSLRGAFSYAEPFART